jgi:SlyX protein
MHGSQACTGGQLRHRQPGAVRRASNSGMNNTYETEQRLTELEIKASYTEDTLDRLNAVVVRQQNQIDLLLRELTALKLAGVGTDGVAPRSLRDELPPHY